MPPLSPAPTRPAVPPLPAAAPAPGTGEAPGSWEQIVREHGARVHRHAYRLTGNAHDADDLTQEVFLRVFRSVDRYVPGTFEGWLHRITTNLFLDSVRRRARIRFESLPADPERVAGDDPGPEARYAATHLDGRLDAALRALPPDFRTAVVLCDVEQLSYEEIAAAVDIKVGTVRSRIHRGRTLLRAALAAEGAETVARPARPVALRGCAERTPVRGS